jgi:signal transduction histidine kinase
MSTREALLNAIAHSHASSIELHIEQQPSQISISVKDNGVGFARSKNVAADGHFGLKGMHERMEGAGGTVTIESKLGEGTLVVLTIPASALHEAARTLREF